MSISKQDIDLLKSNGLSSDAYGDKVNELIRKRYSLSQEFALLRQRDEKPEEWAAYNAYAEECKQKAKLIVYGEVET